MREPICVRTGLYKMVGAKRGLCKKWLVEKIVCIEVGLVGVKGGLWKSNFVKTGLCNYPLA